ncbi:MraZ protein [Microcella alkaliphila]|uniref:Transcriptional regulator MraZ n=1 Tax=Microcella alkaliphila TaxID=279828 RepID=A0A4Q7TTJ1_9MICO|nr:division/cell wall cluster transcriptional repressor MraZ [Microcella alkaliphila]RZT64294.1 MraZ protein [Microcella alkaliphila]
MFLGTHTPKLDDKGRLILPAKFRGSLADGLVLARGQERCIYVFTPEVFQQKVQLINTAPLTSKVARDYVRMFLSGASAEEPDKQFRVTIPPALRQYADLDRDLTVIGAGDRAEIWSTAAWEAYYAAQEETFSSMEEEVIPGLF